MRLQNVIALTHGSLESHPEISEFNAVVIDAQKVKRGNLFVALNHHDIAPALSNGAFGVVYDRDLSPSDTEVAWIRVDDIYDALKRIMRFMLIDKELTAYACAPITLQIAKQLLTPPELIILEGSLQENFTKLLVAPMHATLLFGTFQIDDDLFTDAQKLPPLTRNRIDIIEQTLFETSFIYENVFYERQLLSPFFIPYLEQLFALFKERDIAFKIRPFTTLPHFQPVFTNRALHVKDFGSSERVIIFESDFSLIENQITFIKQQASWANMLYLLPKETFDTLKTNGAIVLYESHDDILKTLTSREFHFALVAGCDKSILEGARDNAGPRQQTLF